MLSQEMNGAIAWALEPECLHFHALVLTLFSEDFMWLQLCFFLPCGGFQVLSSFLKEDEMKRSADPTFRDYERSLHCEVRGCSGERWGASMASQHSWHSVQ